MKLTKHFNKIGHLIHNLYKKREKQRHSRRLGAGRIGKPCERQLWFEFRHAALPNFEGRILRLFERGNIEENWIIQDLQSIGIVVSAFNSRTLEQWEYSMLDDHFVAKLDGRLLDVPGSTKEHTFECKTSSHAVFLRIQKDWRTAKPEHYGQVQIGMLLSGLRRSLYLVVDKNNDDIFSERERYDHTYCKELKDKAERIITATEPPMIGVAKNICTWCDMQKVCSGVNSMLTNCRTCVHSSPGIDGRWYCGGDIIDIPLCSDYRAIKI